MEYTQKEKIKGRKIMIISKRTKENKNGSTYYMGTYCNLITEPKVGVYADGEVREYAEAFIDGEVDEDMYYAFVELIDKLSSMQYDKFRYCSEIRINFSSIGGDVDSGFSIINLIDSYNKSDALTKISFVATGGNYSMAIPILCSGFNRYCYNQSKFMIHQLRASSVGKIHDMEKITEHCRESNEDIKKFIIERTNISEKEADIIFSEEHYFNAEKAFMYGLIHKIISFEEKILELEEPKEENKKKRKK